MKLTTLLTLPMLLNNLPLKAEVLTRNIDE
jgi:hypothetical protein